MSNEMKTNAAITTGGIEDLAGRQEARAQALARRSPKDFPPLGRRESSFEKDDLLAAEVTLPLEPACDVSCVRSVRVRRPFAQRAELILVDLSRLAAA